MFGAFIGTIAALFIFFSWMMDTMWEDDDMYEEMNG